MTTTRTLVIRHKVYKTTARWNFVRMTWHYSTKCLPMKFSLEPEFNRFLANEIKHNLNDLALVYQLLPGKIFVIVGSLTLSSG